MSNGSSKKSHSHSHIDIDFTLRRVFGKSSFRYSFYFSSFSLLSVELFTLNFNSEYERPYQREIITAALEGHDVFVQAGNFLTIPDHLDDH